MQSSTHAKKILALASRQQFLTVHHLLFHFNADEIRQRQTADQPEPTKSCSVSVWPAVGCCEYKAAV